ncbi:collagen-like protein [Dolichospermum sp. ST_con]|nr:collagen-like protein [Dolichospermum sp. ST_con]MDD1419738.1 collagen-like protein [Dolichospermum sp. ST_sed1]MDD1425240.1 collagen-like protein [Dolichospermum sp. ST_sed9]MDD1431897.1 collagen-like protein [Dolichospermum sp. ST_sed6]MDD1438329.1 collagen-like protein [Dolichospermum sp. ST_sed10]MDD1441236.1 collagen-like protein [Dolichospermum sp. ST_sed3]MDD1447059.1 collagen-like protein [Dolichospermum sp. ST_sed8]MDD1455285.1 collagen-like protein [Dolichospermum sp. ST_sed7]M
MHKSFRYHLPFLLTFCLFANLLPAAGAVVCPTNVKESKIAGYYDRDGSNGRSGRDGRSGTNQTINADGSAVNLDLSGKDGEDGEDGELGSRPSCRNYREEGRDNINAPNGGNGGSGGNGGNGGSGGDFTVYYTNLADLKKIAVRAVGGEGGRGGRGARGAAGCSCRQRRWEKERCTGNAGTPNRRCTRKVYRCYDGRDGSDGRDGHDGKPGKLGILSIVNGKEALADDQPTAEIGISQLANQQFNLSKNKWQIRQGAKSLLAIGSIISDEYREFERRLNGTFKLVWSKKQTINNFANQPVKLTLNDNQQIDIAFPENLWVDGIAKTTGSLTEYTVNHAIPKEDVTRLAVGEFANSGQNLSLRIVDLAGKSDFINTRFQIKYRAQDNFDDAFNAPTLYEGEIPSDLVTRSYNNFTISLGKLKIPSQALNPGVKVDIEVVAIRSLGGRFAQQKINWQGVIRKR